MRSPGVYFAVVAAVSMSYQTATEARELRRCGGVSEELALQVCRLEHAADPRDRAKAAKALARLVSPKTPRAALATLVDALGDDYLIVVNQASAAIQRVGARAVALLEPKLRDKRWTMRRAAAETLGQLGRSAGHAAPFLGRVASKDGSMTVRITAAFALARVGPVGATELARVVRTGCEEAALAALYALRAARPVPSKHISSVAAALSHASEQVQRAAVGTLRELGSGACSRLLTYCVGKDDELCNGALAKMGRCVVPAMIAALGNRRAKARSAAATVLGALGRSAASVSARALGKAAFDPDETVRRRAIVALGQLGRAGVPELLRPLLKYSRPYKVTESLARIGKTAVPALLRLLVGPTTPSYARERAMWALQKIGPSAAAAVAGLTWVLNRDPDSELRETAVRALSRIVGGKALSVYLRALGDPAERVRVRATRALTTAGRPALPGLVRALADRKGEVRIAAAEGLQALGAAAERATAQLKKALGDNFYIECSCYRGHCGNCTHPTVGQVAARTLAGFGPKVLPMLIGVLAAHKGKGANRYAQAYVAEVLPDIDNSAGSAIPALEALALDKNGPRGTALEALRKYLPASMPAFSRLSRDASAALRESVVDWLSIDGRPHRGQLRLLRRLARDAAPGVRKIAVRWLAGQPTARKALLRASRDRNKHVRYRAAESLGGIICSKCLARLRTMSRNDPDRDVRQEASRAASETEDAIESQDAIERDRRSRPRERKRSQRASRSIPRSSFDHLERSDALRVSLGYPE